MLPLMFYAFNYYPFAIATIEIPAQIALFTTSFYLALDCCSQASISPPLPSLIWHYFMSCSVWLVVN